MDASAAKVVAAASALAAELDDGMAPFRTELASLLAQLQTSHTNQVALQEKTKSLSTELDAARAAHAEVKAEEDELGSALKQLQEDAGRLSEDAAKGALALDGTRSSVRDLRVRLAELEGTKEAGSGWTSDQLARAAELRTSRDAAVAEV